VVYREESIPAPRPVTHETPLCRVAFRFPALVTGLPAIDGRWLDPPRLRRLSRPVCRFVGGCSCRASAVLRAGRNIPAAGTSLAPLN